MKTKQNVLDSIAAKHGHRDWELARYRLGERHLHVLILEAMEEYATEKLQQFIHNVNKTVCSQCGGTGIIKGGPTDTRQDEPCPCGGKKGVSIINQTMIK